MFCEPESLTDKENRIELLSSLNKSHKAQCFINKPYKPARRWMSLLSQYSDPQEDLDTPIQIELAPFPKLINKDGSVLFGDSRDGRQEALRMKRRTVKPDLVIFATGYKQSFEWLGEGYPRGPQEVDTLEMVDSADTSLSWIGHVRPGVVRRRVSMYLRVSETLQGCNSSHSRRASNAMGIADTTSRACPEGCRRVSASGFEGRSNTGRLTRVDCLPS